MKKKGFITDEDLLDVVTLRRQGKKTSKHEKLVRINKTTENASCSTGRKRKMSRIFWIFELL